MVYNLDNESDDDDEFDDFQDSGSEFRITDDESCTSEGSKDDTMSVSSIAKVRPQPKGLASAPLLIQSDASTDRDNFFLVQLNYAVLT